MTNETQAYLELVAMVEGKPNEYHAVRLGRDAGKPITKNMYGESMIDGLRWDLWLKYRNREVTTFRGRELIKEQ